LTKRTVLIDGDQFLFTATAAVEEEIRWDDQNHVLYCNVEKAWDNLVGMIRRIFERFETELHWLCFSDTYGDTPNFRLAIDPTYKIHRAGSRKPLCYAALRERVYKSYSTLAFPGLEADDLMGIAATKPKANAIIVSQDKDMKTIPCTVWDGKDLLVISEKEADYNHLYQTLIGDNADGYKGCPGVGPVKATKLLKAEGTMTPWEVVVAVYEKAGLTEADALIQARLARILRYSDWNTEKKEPILWTPPSQSN
jgi:DNA polymerase-1